MCLGTAPDCPPNAVIDAGRVCIRVDFPYTPTHTHIQVVAFNVNVVQYIDITYKLIFIICMFACVCDQTL